MPNLEAMACHEQPLQPLGATRRADGSTRFRVWAPAVEHIELHLVEPPREPIAMGAADDGYYEVTLDQVPLPASYFYRLNRKLDRPDPASRFQPRGVHGPSQVVDSTFAWTDSGWKGIAWDDYVLYESHVGTFTPQGTFEAMIAQLDDLAAGGITAIQLMPVAQFPGERNWGYDGVHPFAPQDTYGGPQGLKRLVDACHVRGLAVVLDVVYNHLGPEGNYFAEFGPYFTARHQTPWGPAVNFDGPDSRPVRDYFIANALYWLDKFHIDALRLDATHAIYDDSPTHILAELAAAVHEQARRSGRPRFVIAESNANDPRIVRARDAGGYGVDAQLVDDFHRSLYALTTGARQGAYADFGSLADVAKSYADGFVLTGRMSKYRGRAWGAVPAGIAPNRFVAFASCHDTIGNRPGGRRLSTLLDFETWKLATSACLLSYCTPLVFMGDEYAEPAPFHYFTSHLDPQLADRVRRGRATEFAGYGWNQPFDDPQSPATFSASRLNRKLAQYGRHLVASTLHQELLQIRRELRQMSAARADEPRLEVLSDRGSIVDRRATAARVLLNFGREAVTLDETLAGPGAWRVRFNSAERRWEGTQADCAPQSPLGSAFVQAARSCVVLTQA